MGIWCPWGLEHTVGACWASHLTLQPMRGDRGDRGDRGEDTPNGAATVGGSAFSNDLLDISCGDPISFDSSLSLIFIGRANPV